MEEGVIKPNNRDELLLKLQGLIANWENEVIEFKEAKNDYDFSKIGQYFSAISNEANLRNLQYGWLVFGVRERDKRIIGTSYRDKAGLLKLKGEIALHTNEYISFIEVFEVYPLVDGEEKRVIMFQIPAASAAIPTTWYGTPYGREGDSVVPLSLEKNERIRRQQFLDWSKQYVNDATIDDLDKEAIELARQKYKEKMSNPLINEEVDRMTDEEFLVRRKLIVGGKITNAAMLLLGSEKSDYKFNSVPEASWRVYNSREEVADYKIFKIPFITLSDRIIVNIRNLTYRYLPNQVSLFTEETQQYDQWALRELLNNCIAHTDYSLGGRIYVNEFENKLQITNPGSFIPGSIEPVLSPSYTSPFYRNQLLAESMVMFKMIDTEATGIRRVFNIQRDKYFPMPDYDLSRSNHVRVTIYGKVLDERFMYILHDNPDLDLNTVFLIDQVQKGIPISKDEIVHLRKYHLIEGRAPNVYLSAPLAKTIEDKSQYIHNKGFDNKYYQDMIVDYLNKFGQANKESLRNLLFDKLPDSLSSEQKERKILTLMTALKKRGIVTTDSNSRRKANWILVNNKKEK